MRVYFILMVRLFSRPNPRYRNFNTPRERSLPDLFCFGRDNEYFCIYAMKENLKFRCATCCPGRRCASCGGVASRSRGIFESSFEEGTRGEHDSRVRDIRARNNGNKSKGVFRREKTPKVPSREDREYVKRERPATFRALLLSGQILVALQRELSRNTRARARSQQITVPRQIERFTRTRRRARERGTTRRDRARRVCWREGEGERRRNR